MKQVLERDQSVAVPQKRMGRWGLPHLSLRTKEALWFYLLIGPWLIGFLVFTLFPTTASLLLSFTRYNAIQPPTWIGLQNYSQLLGDDIFWKSLRVTLQYTIIAVPLQLALALFVAVLPNQRVPGMRIIRTLYYLPSVLPVVVTSLLWVWLFNRDFGLINFVIYLLSGLRGPDWLGSERWVMTAIVLISLWSIGSSVVIFLAGLQNVPAELYEVAAIDGAGAMRQFFAITVPMITPVLLYNLLVGMIAAFQVFTKVYVLTKGGPNYASYFYNLYLYENAFSYFNLGLASAQAWILLLIILSLTLVLLRTSGRWVHYEGN